MLGTLNNANLPFNDVVDLDIVGDVLFEDMEWVTPQYSRKEVNWAGAYLADDSRVDEDKVNHAIDLGFPISIRNEAS